MGQIEIYELLKNRRECGDHRYFQVSEIKKMLRAAGKSVSTGTHLQVAQLEAFGYFEAKMLKRKRSHWRTFRLRSKYLSKNDKLSEEQSSS